MCLPATWFLEVMTLCSLEWLLIWVDPVMLFDWPDQQKVFHTKCTWMTSHQSVVPLKFLKAYWYWEPLATISALKCFHNVCIIASKSRHSSFIWGKHCTKVHFSSFDMAKIKKKKFAPKRKKMSQKKKSAPKEKKCIFRLTGPWCVCSE